LGKGNVREYDISFTGKNRGKKKTSSSVSGAGDLVEVLTFITVQISRIKKIGVLKRRGVPSVKFQIRKGTKATLLFLGKREAGDSERLGVKGIPYHG